MSNIQTGAERMPHDLSHLGFVAGQIGRLITISTTPVIAVDSFEMDAVGALRLSPLRRGLAIDSTVDIFTFYVPHRHVYGEQWIKFMKDGVNATPLPTVNTTGYIDHAAFLGTINPDTNKIPKHLFQGRSRHLARKLGLRRKRSSPNVFEMAATETITSIILIKLIRVSLGTVRHPRRFKIVVIDIQITLKQMLRDFIGIRVNRAKKSGMVNITSSVNSRERSGINTILHELNPLFTINVTMRDIKSKNVYSRVNSKATTQWRKTESAN